MAIGDAPKPDVVENKEIARSVRNIMGEYNVLFVHGVSPRFTPEGNSLLKKDTSWEIKLKVLLLLEPAVSASTVKEGDRSGNLWTSVGVVLADGKVASANSRDANTHSASISGQRGIRQADEEIANEIEKAIEQRPIDKYNEFVVEKPRAVALYFSLDFGKDNRGGVTYEQVKEVAEQLGLPVFVLQRGRLINWETEKIDGRYQRVSPDQLYEMPGISDPKKQELKEELLGTDTPFQIEKIRDGLNVDAVKCGRKSYQDIVSGVLRGEEVYIPIHKLYGVAGVNINTPTDYITNIKDAINGAEKSDDSSAEYGAWKEKYLGELSFLLYGFGSQAEQAGDMLTFQTAKDIVEQFVSWSECKRIEGSRLDKDGNFIVTKEDLGIEE